MNKGNFIDYSWAHLFISIYLNREALKNSVLFRLFAVTNICVPDIGVYKHGIEDFIKNCLS